MKRKAIKLILSIFVTVSVAACAKIETTEPLTVEAKTMENEYIIDIREIVSFEETETGIMLHMKDGTGCYIEDIENVTEYVYPICDVVTTYGKDYPTKLGVKMPDGSIHKFNIIDPPKEVEEVVFQTLRQDDYKSYKIVGVR